MELSFGSVSAIIPFVCSTYEIPTLDANEESMRNVKKSFCIIPIYSKEVEDLVKDPFESDL